MKRLKKQMIGIAVVFSLVLTSCGTSSYTGGGYGGVNHYHYGMGAGWGMPYYGDDVIIVDDGIDIGMPDAVDYPVDDW